MPLPPHEPQALADMLPRPPIPTVPVPLQLPQTLPAFMAASWRFWSSDLNIFTPFRGVVGGEGSLSL